MAQYMLLVYQEEVDAAEQAEREQVTPTLVELHAGLPDQRGEHDRALVAKRARDGGRDRVGRVNVAAHARSSTASSGTSAPASRARFTHSSAGMTGRTSTVP